MGQYFQLFNLDSPIKVKNSVGGKFGEFFFYSGHGDVSLLEALWDPAEGGKGVEVISTAEVDDGEDFILPTPADYNSSKGPIGRLSTELISMILEEVEDLVDLVALMMTCQRFWNIGRPVLEKFIQNMFVISWAGDRLVVFGDYANLADLPAGMLNKSEMKWIEDTEMSDDDLWEIIKVLQVHNQHRNFNVAPSKDRSTPENELYYTRDGFATSWIFQRRNRHLLRAFRALVSFKDRHGSKNFFSGRAVLRNLKTKEYICWTTVMRSEPHVSTLRLEELTFEHLLYIRTVWSSDPSMAIADGTAVYRGVWAGHPFDVARIESVQDVDGASIDGWTDVSAQVVQEIGAIWEGSD